MEVNKIVTVVLKKDDISPAEDAYQWNYGQILRIQGGNLPKAVEVHFSLSETSGTSVTRIGTTTDGVTEAPIPDNLLENNNCSQDYTIYAYIYLEDGTTGRTEYEIAIPVKARTKPEVPGTPEEPELFRETIQAVNDAADRAEQAEQNAKASATEAGKYAASASESAAAAEKTKEDALKEVGEKKREAIEAIQEQEETSVGKITTHTDDEIQRIQNQTAESKGELEQTITNAGVSKEELDESIQTASNTKTALDKSTELAGTAKTELDTSTQKAGEAKTALDGSAKTAGEMQETLGATVKQAGALDTSLSEKIETGTQLKTDLVASGEKAVQDIQNAGSEQLGKMQTVAEEFTADREQITKNKEDIAGLSEKIYNTDIEEEVSGAQIVAEDSAEGRGLRNLKVYGWSKQQTTTGAQLFPTITPSTEVKSGITVEYMEHGKIQISGTAEKTMDFMTPTFELLAGTYTLSMGVKIDNALIRCTLSTNEGLPFFDILNNGASKTETTTDNMELYLLLRVYGGKTIDLTIQPMLNAGTSPLPWEPYTGGQPSPSPDYPQEIVSAGAGGEVEVTICGKNLFDGNTNISKTQYYKLPIQMKNGAKLTMSFIGVGTGTGSAKAYCRDSRGKFCGTMFFFDIKSGVNKYSSTKICNGGEERIYFYGTDFSHFFENIYDIQIEINGTATDYKPYYTPQSLSISTPTGFPAIPVDTDGNYTDADGQQWIADYVDFKRGKYVQNVGTMDLNDMQWRKDDNYISSSTVLQNFKGEANRAVLPFARWACNYGGDCFFLDNNGVVYFGAEFSKRFLTLELFQAYLQERDSIIFYQLVSPIERDLTPEEIQVYQSFITYAPTTIVENDADCHMELGYVADPKAYIDKKFAELSAAIITSASEAE